MFVATQWSTRCRRLFMITLCWAFPVGAAIAIIHDSVIECMKC